MKSINPNGSVIEIGPRDSVREIVMLAGKHELRVLQFSQALPMKVFDALNTDFFSYRPDVRLRAYGFYGSVCDLSFCSRLPNLERFSADCLQEAVGMEHITQMPCLRTLGIGIWNLESLAFLSGINSELTELIISESKSKKPDLQVLARFRSLTKLFLNGQQKNIEVLSALKKLQILSLSSLKLSSLSFLRELLDLWSLVIMLGGTRDLSTLEGLSGLKYLEMSWIREFDDLDVVSSLSGLQHLQLDRLAHIKSLPDLERLSSLRRVTMDLMKGLIDISSLVVPPVLEEVIHIDARVSPEAYIPILQKTSLKAAHAGFGNTAKNNRFKELCEANGIRTGFMKPFVFT